MDSQDVERGEASTSTHGARRQQAREYRRRLLRSSRTATTAHDDHGHGTPMPAVEDEDRAYNERPQVGISPDPRWTFQTPEGQFSIAHHAAIPTNTSRVPPPTTTPYINLPIVAVSIAKHQFRFIFVLRL